MKKILIVEDEEAILEILETKFKLEKFETLRAKDGQEGLKIALQEKPDLILLDIIMPKMDGLTVLEKLKADEVGKNIPVIILTNLSDDQKVEEAVSAGKYEYLIKSDWKIEDVVKEVKNKLGIK